MRFSAISKVLGKVLIIEGILLLLPALVAFLYRESVWPFLMTAAVCLAAGIPMACVRSSGGYIHSKEGFVATGLAWIVMSLTGMLPFMISGSIPGFCDAFFETVSGFTTTGASILTDVEALSHGELFWRSFMHWIGGMGILVFMMALEPVKGATTMNLMKAESPGPSISKLLPRASETAKALYTIYIVLTAAALVFLLVARMPVFDAVCITLGAAGTGGFSVLNSGCASYTVLQQAIITVSMIAFGVNFSFYFLLYMKKFRWALGMEEVRAYFLIIAAAVAVITVDLSVTHTLGSVPLSFHHAAFHVGSIITTTGYGIGDITLYPMLSQFVLVLLMFIGACAGSTGGGFKVSRLIILSKSFSREIQTILHPDVRKRVFIDGKAVDETTIRTTGAYGFLYAVILLASVLLISVDKVDEVSAVTSVIATFNNIGPGLGIVGTCGSYASFSGFSKLILSADMLIGRLEIFPIMILFSRSTWKRF